MNKILESLLTMIVRKGLNYESDSVTTDLDIPLDGNVIKVKVRAENVHIKIEKE